MDVSLPSGSWDTHIHCFDLQWYPFRSTRAYTHGPAPLGELVENSLTNQVVLVQASIEDGHDGLVAHFSRIRKEYAHILARGTICMDESWTNLDNSHVDVLHQLGVRSWRIHEQFLLVAQSYAAKTHGWSISAQLPLQAWTALKQFLLHDKEINCHDNCRPQCLRRAGGYLQFRIQIFSRAAIVWPPDDFHNMQSVIQSFADTASCSLLWGSGWPHVNPANKSVHLPIDAPKIDIRGELKAL
ncbi:conserved hypothetical protein [Talaromyces stipitatus ATCC 10500]|uniref:Amidohydrolase-related domain-containing protein n=1 Tax=Talaromyces stipitatus (strain ATCC 10500 / CBS 375.48 / QM 6759 / NRRL 1006) TaxID=441959 RepID=B8MH81_TALSN|nr:uncharacterized protein TSTA_019570 [Talaromyces stipitatus ATCC 10500]EED16895.1 conserved hypothetical protein [Talaromyces stipitatus ATCC 10500]